MVFRRRDPRPLWRVVQEFFYPRGGWWRAIFYIWYRLCRLPDDPHRIARGIAAGVFISFTPFFGLHFVGAALIAWLLRGNVVAALIATFFGNPLTTPLIAQMSLEAGYWVLGLPGHMPVYHVPGAVSQASMEIWRNAEALFTATPVVWTRMDDLWREVFFPYMVGGVGPGLVAAFVCYAVSVPLVRAYQAHRARKAAERAERLRRRQAGGGGMGG